MAHADFSTYKIIFSKNAEKFLDTQDKQTQTRILKKIKLLRTNSKNLDIKKLKINRVLYRLRVGDFRVIYEIRHEQLIIYIVTIGHRQDVYQSLSYT